MFKVSRKSTVKYPERSKNSLFDLRQVHKNANISASRQARDINSMPKTCLNLRNEYLYLKFEDRYNKCLKIIFEKYISLYLFNFKVKKIFFKICFISLTLSHMCAKFHICQLSNYKVRDNSHFWSQVRTFLSQRNPLCHMRKFAKSVTRPT